MKLRCLAMALPLFASALAHSMADDSIPLAISVRERIPDADWQHIAEHYSFVWTMFPPATKKRDISAENERVKWIKSLNPKLTVLVYGGSINAANTSLPAWNKPEQHPDWFLKDEAGQWVGDYEYGALHLDPGNPDWQEYRAKVYAEQIARYGYDGAYIDLVGPTTNYINHKKASKAVNPKTGKAYTDAEWKEAMLELLRVVRRHIGNKPLFIVGPRGKDYFKYGYAEFLSIADGVVVEFFTGWTRDPMQPFKSDPEDWKADVDALADCAARGKQTLVFASIKKRGSSEPKEPFDAIYRFVAASFLLGTEGRDYMCFAAKEKPVQPSCLYRPGDDILPSYRQAPLGRARGTYQKLDGAYQREFEHGRVLVNPTSREIRVPLSGQWKTDTGSAVASPMVLPPGTGAILLKAE